MGLGARTLLDDVRDVERQELQRQTVQEFLSKVDEKILQVALREKMSREYLREEFTTELRREIAALRYDMSNLCAQLKNGAPLHVEPCNVNKDGPRPVILDPVAEKEVASLQEELDAFKLR